MKKPFLALALAVFAPTADARTAQCIHKPYSNWIRFKRKRDGQARLTRLKEFGVRGFKTWVMLLLLGALAFHARAATTLSVNSDANIFGAGHSLSPAPGGGQPGSLPPVYSFAAGPGKVLTFSSVSGQVSLSTGVTASGADGYFNVAPTDINSFGGIAGIQHGGAGFLVGIFLGPDEPVNPAPSRLDFSTANPGTGFLRLTPAIGQTFFIGDGLSGTASGSIQCFDVPPAATRLFLGFADGTSYSGDPGQYQDNSGTLTVTFDIREALVCPSDKTVLCGTAWEFDPPTAINTCCGANVAGFTTMTNSLCPLAITRTWLITDACGNTYTCSQKVTVAAPLQFFPVTVNSSTASTYTSPYGHGSIVVRLSHDNLPSSSASFDPTVWTAKFATLFPFANNTWANSAQGARAVVKGTFAINIDLTQFHILSPSFRVGLYNIQDSTLPGGYTLKAFDEMGAQISPPFTWNLLGNEDDNLHPGANAQLVLNSTSGALSASASQTGWGSDAAFWNHIPSDTTNIVITGVLPSTEDGVVLFFAENAPTVLTCPPDKTVVCGDIWEFGPVSAVDACGTEVPMTFITETNGVCPSVITRIWQAVDACGNATTCTQKVTVVDTTAPVFACATNSAVISGPILNPANGHYYYLLSQNTWTASEAEALALGGHLATVRNQAENAWIYSQFAQFGGLPRGLWIGLNDVVPPASEGDFRWVSGESVSFLNWALGEPVNQNGLDDYVHLFWPGDPRQPQWNDTWNFDNLSNIPLHGVVEALVPSPLFPCATNKTVACGLTWNFDEPTAIDNCGGTNVTISILRTETNSICPLVMTRIWVAADLCGNTNTHSQTVTVVNTNLPTISCPSNIVVSSCVATQVFFTATGWDLCNSNLNVICTPPSGSTFLPGTTNTVVCVVTNCTGAASCSFTVTVLGLDPPVITCPSPITTNTCGTNVIVNFTVPLVTGGALASCVPASGSSFPVGTTTVTCTATNACSTNTCTFDVIVVQTPQVTITCPPPILTNICGTNVIVNFAAPLVTGGTLQSCVPASGSSFPVGTTTVTCTATNACSTNSCTFTVTVLAQSFTMSCPTNKTVMCGSAWKFDAPTNVVTSCCTNYASTFTTQTNGVCPVVITRTWIITDGCGNSNTCSQAVTIVNTNLPAINCPSNIVVSSCVATQVFYTATGWDLCNSNLNVVCTPPSGSTFLPGTTNTVVCVVTNCAGSASCTFTVTVNCPTDPCAQPPANMVLWLPFDETSGAVSTNFAGGNNGTRHNGPVVVSGQVAQSLTFNGSNQYVEVASYDGINFGTNDFSIDAWVRRGTNDTATSACYIVDKRLEFFTTNYWARGYAFYITGSQGTLGLQLADGATANYLSTLGVPNDNQWHHVAVTVQRVNPAGIRFFLDGAPDPTPQNPTARQGSLSTPAPLRVASRSAALGFLFRGSIDEVELFNRSLGTNEIAALYDAGSAGKCKCLNVVNRSVTCIATNETYLWKFEVINQSSNILEYLSFPDLPPGVGINQNPLFLDQQLLPGQGRTVTLQITNTVGLTNLCLTVTGHTRTFVEVCSVTNCLVFEPCCAFVVAESRQAIPKMPNCFNYTLTFRNVSSDSISYIVFIPEPFNNCVTFTPNIIYLPTPVLPGQTSAPIGPIKVCLDPACPKPQRFVMSFHNANLEECCSTKHRLPPGKPPIEVSGPVDMAAVIGGKVIDLTVTVSGEINLTKVAYYANDRLIASNSVPPFSSLWSNPPFGEHVLRAEGIEADGGGIWTSEPITIYTLRTEPGAPEGPVLINAGIRDGQFTFALPTEAGINYILEWSATINGSWTALRTFQGDGSQRELSDSIVNGTQRFYRVRIGTPLSP